MAQTPVRDDVDYIMTIMDAAFDPHFREAWNRRQVEDALLRGNGHYYLIDGNGLTYKADANTYVPAAGFSLSRTGYDEEELLLLAVTPQYRGRGLGLAILQELAESAANRGARRLLLEMRRGNPAERLYCGFGFKTIGERKDYYRTGTGQSIDAITFALELPQII